MADNDKQEDLLRKFLDGDLDPEQEKQALHMIADDPDMRDMLRFDHGLNRAGRCLDPDSFHVPEGFADQVMSQITAGQPAQSAYNLRDRITVAMNRLLTPLTVEFRPVFAMAAVLVIALTLSFLLVRDQSPAMTTMVQEPAVKMVASQEQQVWIRFIYFDDQAESIAVAGDFSDWEPISLAEEVLDGKQVWTGLIPVTRDEHRYMFVKNGEQWVTDPLAEMHQDDGFGNKNAVLFL
ncbi:MAG: hypothetical protein WD266_03270 [Balneolales bacterium]